MPRRAPETAPCLFCYYLFPGWVAATRILAVEKSELFFPYCERLRGAVMAATRIQAMHRGRVAREEVQVKKLVSGALDSVTQGDGS